MNTRTKKPATLCAALGGAGLARTGAMLALALGAAQAGATTYTVPLQFNITLAAPVCNLKVGGNLVDSSTAAVGSTVVTNLTPTSILATSSPLTILGALPGMTNFTTSSPGLYAGASMITGATSRSLDAPPAATAQCTLGTPMKVTVANAAGFVTTSALSSGAQAGKPSVGTMTPAALPIGMLMGLASFGSATAATGSLAGITWNNAKPELSTTATGLEQTIGLTVAAYATSNTNLPSGAAGLWSYNFDVSLDF